jgi:hypothetical protein
MRFDHGLQKNSKSQTPRKIKRKIKVKVKMCLFPPWGKCPKDKGGLHVART